MTELTQSLKLAVTRYPGTMAELARRAAIDRSTLYKILSGQRTPRQEQVERLADALELNEEQKTALLTQYKRRGRSTDPKIRAELHRLLEAAFRVQDYTRREGVISNEAAQETSWTPHYVGGARAVEAAIFCPVIRGRCCFRRSRTRCWTRRCWIGFRRWRGCPCRCRSC